MRVPCVAGQFYPGTPHALSDQVESLLATCSENKTQATGVVAPHAGYVYSGQLAAKTLGSAVIPEHVIIIGPNHRGSGAKIAISNQTWDMVLGPVATDDQLIDDLKKHPDVFSIDELAHQSEHSLEVQVPFLQYLQSNLSITPIVISHISYTQCEEVASLLAAAIRSSGEKVLIVASSDMNHYESRKVSGKKDSAALEAISNFDPSQLYKTVHKNRITMCGVIPVVITMLASQILGAENVEIIGYTDSGHVSGDTAQVVGYAGVHIF